MPRSSSFAARSGCAAAQNRAGVSRRRRRADGQRSVRALRHRADRARGSMPPLNEWRAQRGRRGARSRVRHDHGARRLGSHLRSAAGQNELIQRIAAANQNTIVVVTSGGAVDMNGWLERVPALLQAWYPGQEGGTALAEILFGDVNPSGKLPATFERRAQDNPVVGRATTPSPARNTCVYKEGVFVGYRGYEKHGTTPLFPFGHGLSYSRSSSGISRSRRERRRRSRKAARRSSTCRLQ